VGGGPNLATAAHFLLFNAAAIVGLAALAAQAGRGRAAVLAGATAIAVGALLFSGDLALRALMEVKLLGGSAPQSPGWVRRPHERPRPRRPRRRRP